MIEDVMKQLAQQMDSPVMGPEDRWLNYQMVKGICKAMQKFITITSIVSGLSQSKAQEFSQAIGPFPTKEVGLNRLAWLKHMLVCCDKCSDLLRNIIRKMEQQKP